MSDTKSLIKQYLNDTKLMHLATSIDNQPWVCNVWFAADSDFNIYWFSSTARRHSKEVLVNNKVSGSFALPQTPEDKPRGLQFQGVATQLKDQKDVEKAISVFANRIFTREKIDDLIKNRNHAFYRIKPSLFVLFDFVNFPDNPRQEMRM